MTKITLKEFEMVQNSRMIRSKLCAIVVLAFPLVFVYATQHTGNDVEQRLDVKVNAPQDTGASVASSNKIKTQ